MENAPELLNATGIGGGTDCPSTSAFAVTVALVAAFIFSALSLRVIVCFVRASVSPAEAIAVSANHDSEPLFEAPGIKLLFFLTFPGFWGGFP
jgi:hypothetical protein